MYHFTRHWWCSTSFWVHETTLHVTIQICILMVTFTDLPSSHPFPSLPSPSLPFPPPLQEVALVKDHLRALWESSQQHCVGGGDKEVRKLRRGLVCEMDGVPHGRLDQYHVRKWGGVEEEILSACMYEHSLPKGVDTYWAWGLKPLPHPPTHSFSLVLNSYA